jgi:hypothetical protein
MTQSTGHFPTVVSPTWCEMKASTEHSLTVTSPVGRLESWDMFVLYTEKDHSLFHAFAGIACPIQTAGRACAGPCHIPRLP